MCSLSLSLSLSLYVYIYIYITTSATTYDMPALKSVLRNVDRDLVRTCSTRTIQLMVVQVVQQLAKKRWSVRLYAHGSEFPDTRHVGFLYSSW